MKTSRLKNIVIVILLLVNAFLLFLLLSRRAEERDSNERRVEQLCTLFLRWPRPAGWAAAVRANR